ncbi:MAG: hypothetical protein WBL50_05235 [Candidatus Acidiferrum sp.]
MGGTMRFRCFAILCAIFLYSQGSSISAQTATTGTTQPQASMLLAQSAAALTGSTTISDVTLTGKVQSLAGSDDESGTVSLKAMAAGESRMDLALSSGVRSEIRSFDSNNSPIGAWSGSDAVQHAISYHNLLTDSSWFFPALTLNRLVSNSGIVGTYIGQETLNGQSVLHISLYQPPVGVTGQTAALPQHLSQMDLFLNPTTLLPVALSFTTHPDNNALLDIPVQVQFSNYQSIGGVQIPFQVQKFLNGTLSLDLQVQSAVLNSGLSASGFSVQVTQ